MAKTHPLANFESKLMSEIHFNDLFSPCKKKKLTPERQKKSINEKNIFFGTQRRQKVAFNLIFVEKKPSTEFNTNSKAKL